MNAWIACSMVLMGIAAAGDEPMEVACDDETLAVKTGERTLLRYRYANVPFKPYVIEFYTPAGINVLRDAPFDHLHHHALMYAVKVDGVNFWEERAEPGRQAHRSFTHQTVEVRDGTPWATFTEHLDWLAPNADTVLLQERRTIEVPKLSEGEPGLLIWQSVFEPPPGKENATLTGAHYHGLGMRFLRSMDIHGAFRTPEGEPGEAVQGIERLTPANWCAYTVDAHTKPVTAAMFGHPSNVRHPTLWFTMTKPFAYLSATLNLSKEPLEVAAGKPLVLRYAVALWDGQADTAEIDKLYERWLQWPTSERRASAE